MKGEILLYGAITALGFSLVAIRIGLAHSVRIIGNFWYALSYAIGHFSLEFPRLNAESRKIRDSQAVRL